MGKEAGEDKETADEAHGIAEERRCLVCRKGCEVEVCIGTF